MYTAPLSTLISSISMNHHLYADDTQLFFSFLPPNFDSSITHLQNVIQQFSSRTTANLLILSTSRTESVLIGPRKQPSPNIAKLSCQTATLWLVAPNRSDDTGIQFSSFPPNPKLRTEASHAGLRLCHQTVTRLNDGRQLAPNTTWDGRCLFHFRFLPE